jgi:hypothetical protein
VAAAIGHSIYVSGGQGRDRFLKSVDVFEQKLNSWHMLRRDVCGHALNGKFLLIGEELMRNWFGDRLESI